MRLDANMLVNVGVREWMLLNVYESTCKSVCLGANMHLDVWVHECNGLNVRECTCNDVCCWCQYDCECGCS